MKKISFFFALIFPLAKALSQDVVAPWALFENPGKGTVYISPRQEEGGPGALNLQLQKIPGSPVKGTRPGQDLPDTISGRPYALVAGGSKGIGYAIAEALARRGYNLILIARHMDSLISAKNKLQSAYGVYVEILSYDLSKEESATSIAEWCFSRNIPLKMLCNVAGFGGTRDYPVLSLDSLRYMVRLNIESTMALTLTLLPLLERNAPACILNVSSMAGFAPIPSKNLYSATKSAVVFFSYALRYQLKDKNISVSCLAPGPVFTKPSIKKVTKEKLGWLGMKMAVSPERVGEIAVRETINKKLIIVPGTLAKITATLSRFLPRRWVVALNGRLGS